MTLQEKIDKSIALIKQAEPLALNMNPNGFHLAFSGGKDSQVIYELTKMAGVKFTTHFNMTTVDPIEVLQFIKDNYPDVIWHRAKHGMFDLIKHHKKFLPTRKIRFCCEYLKEGLHDNIGFGSVNIIGIRKQESAKRMQKFLYEDYSKKGKKGKKVYNDCNEIKHECYINGEKLMFFPILEWTDRDVWAFIKLRNLKYCSLYDNGYKRIGCILYPMASYKQKLKEAQLYPRFANAYKLAIKYLKEHNYLQNDLTIDETFDWWIKGRNLRDYKELKKQTKLILNEE
jgi:phosphoadenosine phosphosulfate reductase